MINTEICPAAFRCITEKLRQCQESLAGHPKLSEKLLADMKKFELIDFFNAFTHALGSVLLTMQKNPRVDRIIDFMARFIQALSTTSKTKENEKKDKQEATTSGDATASNDNTVSQTMDCDEEEDDVEEHPFIIALFDFLIEKSKVSSDSVRYRCCQILGKLMGTISNEQFIDEDLYDRLCDALLERLKDINSRVQVQALSAIYRLQDPTDRECRVTKAIVFLMTHDPNWQVRYQALSHCAFSKHTLRDIIDRVRDPHPTVRRKALVILSEKALIKYISIEKRLFILNYSLKSDDESVLDTCCKKLLPSWLAFKENDLVKLLKALDVVGANETCELMLNKMYEDSTLDSLCNDFVQSGLINEDKVIAKDKLDAESAFYWHWICSKCKVDDKQGKSEQQDATQRKGNDSNEVNDSKNNQVDMTLRIEGENLLDNELLPSLTYFCDYVEDFLLTKLESGENDQLIDNEFVMKQLVNMLSMIDMSDPHGKKKLIGLCEKLFSKPNMAFAFDSVMNVYKLVVPNAQQRINRIVELISDIKDPASSTQTQKDPVETLSATSLPPSDSSTSLNIYQLDMRISELKFERLKKKDTFDNLYKDLKTQKPVDLNFLGQLREEISAIEDELKTLQATKSGASSTLGSSGKPQAESVQESNVAPGMAHEFDPIESAMHCLKLASCLLKDTDIKSLTPQIRSLCDTLIITNISCVDEDVRQEAVMALNLVCILKLELAQRYIPLLLEIIQRDKKEIMMEAFKAVINCIMAFSINKLINLSTEDQIEPVQIEEATQRIMQVLTSCLDHEDVEVSTLAVEGFCKLYMCGHIISAKLFSKLLIMYYSPLNEGALRLKSILSAFLPQFAFFKPTYQLCVEEAFMITVRCLLGAPTDSYLSEIDLLKVVETLFRLTNPKNLLQFKKQRAINTNFCHENIIKSICYEILKDDNTYKIKTYLKFLPMADLTDAYYLSLKEISKLAYDVSNHKSLEDKPTEKKAAQKFYESVMTLLKSKPEYKEEQSNQDETSRLEETQQPVPAAQPELTGSQKSDEQDMMIDQKFKLLKKGVKTGKKANQTGSQTATFNETQATVVNTTVAAKSNSALRSSPRLNRNMPASKKAKSDPPVTEIVNEEEDDESTVDQVTVVEIVNVSIVDESLEQDQDQVNTSPSRTPRSGKKKISKENETELNRSSRIATRRSQSVIEATTKDQQEYEPPAKVLRANSKATKTTNSSSSPVGKRATNRPALSARAASVSEETNKKTTSSTLTAATKSSNAKKTEKQSSTSASQPMKRVSTRSSSNLRGLRS